MMSVVTVLLTTSASLLFLVHHQYKTHSGSFGTFLWGIDMGCVSAYPVVYVCNSITLIFYVSFLVCRTKVSWCFYASLRVRLHLPTFVLVSRNLHQDSVNWSINIRLERIWSKELVYFRETLSTGSWADNSSFWIGFVSGLSCEVRSTCSSASMFPCFLCLVIIVDLLVRYIWWIRLSSPSILSVLVLFLSVLQQKTDGWFCWISQATSSYLIILFPVN